MNHVHKLKRHVYKTKVKIYFCVLPDCHYKIDCALTLGKETICNLCGEVFIINEYTIKLARPHCTKCGKIKIKGADGKGKFIHKQSPMADASSVMAEDNLEDLRSRLQRLSEASKDVDL